MAKFSDVKRAVELTILSGRVPALKGKAGTGKTQLMSSVAKELNLYFITIEMSLLKDGEIGGLPVVTQKTENGITFKTTEYAIHSKIKEMNHALTITNDGSEILPDRSNAKYDGVLLFLDEFNRSEQNVMQESMNIILNREINGFKIPEDVYITCAMNPSSGDGNHNYQTNELDPAQLDRLCVITMDSDARNWLDWATSDTNYNEDDDIIETGLDFVQYDKNQYKTPIHNDIIEFISSNTEFLYTLNEDTGEGATPRSWEFASQIMRTYELNKKIFNDTHLGLAIKGTIGENEYVKFANFIANNKNPLIPAEEFFKGKEINKEVWKKFNEDTDYRQYIMAKGCMQLLNEESKLTKQMKDRYITILKALQSDRTVALMRYTKLNYKGLHDKLMKEAAYYEHFIELVQQLCN